jgi:hypothetical protein
MAALGNEHRSSLPRSFLFPAGPQCHLVASSPIMAAIFFPSSASFLQPPHQFGPTKVVVCWGGYVGGGPLQVGNGICLVFKDLCSGQGLHCL